MLVCAIPPAKFYSRLAQCFAGLVGVSILISLVQCARFGGRNKADSRSTKFLSDAGKLATGATFVHDSRAEKTPKFSVPLMQVPVHAGWESHLLIRADVRLQTSNTLNVVPLINFDFYNNAGSTITMPLEAKSLLPVRVLPIPNLSRFQTMQRICLIPAGATSMKFTYEQNFAGRVELKNLKVRGPIW